MDTQKSTNGFINLSLSDLDAPETLFTEKNLFEQKDKSVTEDDLAALFEFDAFEEFDEFDEPMTQIQLEPSLIFGKQETKNEPSGFNSYADLDEFDELEQLNELEEANELNQLNRLSDLDQSDQQNPFDDIEQLDDSVTTIQLNDVVSSTFNQVWDDLSGLAELAPLDEALLELQQEEQPILNDELESGHHFIELDDLGEPMTPIQFSEPAAGHDDTWGEWGEFDALEQLDEPITQVIDASADMLFESSLPSINPIKSGEFALLTTDNQVELIVGNELTVLERLPSEQYQAEQQLQPEQPLLLPEQLNVPTESDFGLVATPPAAVVLPSGIENGPQHPQAQFSWWQNLSLMTKARMLAIAVGTLPALTLSTGIYFWANQSITPVAKVNQPAQVTGSATKTEQPDALALRTQLSLILIFGTLTAAILSSLLATYLVRLATASLATAAAKSEAQQHEQEALQVQLYQLLSSVEGATRGDLTVRADVTAGDMGTVADFFNAIIESLRQIVTQVKDSAIRVNASVGEKEGAIRQLAADALQQATEITHTLDSVERMTLSIQTVADNARQAAEVARQASTTAVAGGTAMDQTVKSILNLRETVGETTKKVKRLGESSQQISKVVSLINQIALQTNLLAINASIEATRAGEEGRGFAVVAEEVGELAARSAAATKEIEQIVANIQLETIAVVEAMELGTAQVVEGTNLVESTKQSLEQILQVSAQIDGLVQSISTATVSQAETSQQVTSLMQDIAKISERTSQTSLQVSSSLQETVAVTQQLQQSVNTFKIVPEV
jgi:methyl-accepting chemotaxis protein